MNSRIAMQDPRVESPGIRLLLGPPNAGKLGRVLQWWAERRGLGPVIVVPTRPDVPLVTLELLERAGPALGHPPVVTFDGLAAGVVKEQMGSVPAAEILGDVERRLVIRRALAHSATGRLRTLLGHPGGPEALDDLLREFDESGVPPDRIAAGLLGWAGSSGEETARDLASFVEEYKAILTASGRSERADAIRAAVGVGEAWARPIACYGFVSLTPLQRELLRRLALTAPVLVSLIDDPDRRWAAYFATEVAQWVDEAQSIERLEREELAYSSPSIAALERAFMRADEEQGAMSPADDERRSVQEHMRVDYEGSTAAADGLAAAADGPTAAVDRAPADDSTPADSPAAAADGPTAGVRFLLSSGRRAEAELVGREVVALLRAGVPADQIGILVRDVGPWHRLLGRVLRAYGVPHRIDGEVGFAETGLGAALLAVLQGVAEPALEPLLSYIRSPYCAASAAEGDRLESALRGARIVDGPALVGAVGEAVPEAFALVQAAVVHDAARGPVVETGALRRLTAQMLATASRGRAPRSWELEGDVASFRAADEALAQLERGAEAGWLDEPGDADSTPLGGQGASGAAEGPLPRLELVVACLRSVRVRLSGADDHGVVRVMSVQRARARRFHAVFVMGLADGEFPGRERAPLLLTARQRAEANQAAGAHVFSEPPAGQEAGLFALAISRPWQLLVLSGRDAEDGGEPVTSSPYWSESRRLLGTTSPVERRTLSDVVHPVADAPSEREYLRACAATGSVPFGPGRACVMDASGSWDCRPTRLSGVGLDRLAARATFSVSEIEQYSSCPFSWFVGSLVRINEMEESIDARILGSVLHRALRHLYVSLKDERLLPLRPSSASRAGELAVAAIDKAMHDLAPSGRPGEKRLLRLRVEERVAAALESDVQSAGRLVPSAFESPLPPGGVDIGGVRISGRIDRLDGAVAGQPVFVIDYKSGGGAGAPAFGSRGAVQVPLYLLGLRALDPSRVLAGGAYLYLRGPATKGIVVADHVDAVGERLSTRSRRSVEEFEEVLDNAVDVAREAVEGMRAGRIPAEPAGVCPGYCELRGLCRRGDLRRRW